MLFAQFSNWDELDKGIQRWNGQNQDHWASQWFCFPSTAGLRSGRLRAFQSCCQVSVSVNILILTKILKLPCSAKKLLKVIFLPKPKCWTPLHAWSVWWSIALLIWGDGKEQLHWKEWNNKRCNISAIFSHPGSSTPWTLLFPVLEEGGG